MILTRYLTFEKFATLLTQGLFIPRADMFEDSLEGIIPYPDAITTGFTLYDDAFFMEKFIEDLFKTKSEQEVFYVLSEYIQYYLNEHKCIKSNPYNDIKKLKRIAYELNAELSNRMKDRVNFVKDRLREIYFNLFKEEFKAKRISCWFSSTEESLPMWDMYTKHNGVAIQVNKEQIDKLFKDNDLEYVPRKVEYVEDFEQEFKKWSEKDYFGENIIIFEKKEELSYPDYWFLRKRKVFEHENEYRYIVTPKSLLDRLYIKNGNFNENDAFMIKIDRDRLEDFFDKIIVAPKANKQFYNLIKALANDYGINENKIQKSSIANLW